MNLLFFTLSALLSYRFNSSLSRQGHKINKRMPYLKVKCFQFSPNIKIILKSRTIHLHHWFTYSIILIITLTFKAGFLDSLFSQGFLLGGIIQGLTFPDWKKFVIKNEELESNRQLKL